MSAVVSKVKATVRGWFLLPMDWSVVRWDSPVLKAIRRDKSGEDTWFFLITASCRLFFGLKHQIVYHNLRLFELRFRATSLLNFFKLFLAQSIELLRPVREDRQSFLAALNIVFHLTHWSITAFVWAANIDCDISIISKWLFLGQLVSFLFDFSLLALLT